MTLSSQKRRCSMGKQVTEMLKGTLEGIVLAILSSRPAYGYEITAWLREKGFSDIAEGTVYALLIRIEQRGLVDVEKVPSEKGPPRKVYSLNAQGREYLEEFWRTWSFLDRTARTAPRRRRVTWRRSGSRPSPDRSSRRSSSEQHKARIEALPEPYGTAVEGVRAVPHVLRRHHGRRHHDHDARATSPTCGSRPPSTELRCARSSAMTPSSSARPSSIPMPGSSGSTRNASA